MKINDIKNPTMVVKRGQGNKMGFYILYKYLY